jgi:predicted metal-dependent hydrolase
VREGEKILAASSLKTGTGYRRGLLQMQEMKYLGGYPEETKRQVQLLVENNKLAAVLLKRYAVAHDIRTDKALYQYVVQLKKEFLGNAEPVSKVLFDNKLHVIKHALGLHTSISRIQGSKLKSKREIRVSSLFKNVPPEFLKMIAVHELAHFKEKEHDRAFYKLCEYMEPNYHQFEFDLRLYLTHMDLRGEPLWSSHGAV